MMEAVTEKKVRDIKAANFHEVSRPLLEKTCNFRHRVHFFDHAFFGFPKKSIDFRKNLSILGRFQTIFDMMEAVTEKKSGT